MGRYRIHAEVARGSDSENDEYCSKDGAIIHEYGQPVEGLTEKGGKNNHYSHSARMAADPLAQILHSYDILESMAGRHLGKSIARQFYLNINQAAKSMNLAVK
jgi:hypothetical protein